MKKFLAMAMLVFGLIICQAAHVEATDVYVGTWEGGWKAYVMTESYRGESNSRERTAEMYCRVKTVSPKGTVKYIDYSFSFYGDRVTFKDSTGASGVFYTDGVGQYKVENEIIILLWKLEREKSSPSSQSNIPEKVYVGLTDYGESLYILPKTIREISFKSYNGFSVQTWLSNADYSSSEPWNFVYRDGEWIYLGVGEITEWSRWAMPVSKIPLYAKVVEVANRYR